MTNQMGARMSDIEDIFQQRVTYHNPDLQRPYVWKKSQWSDLWADVVRASKMDGVIGNHFLGAIVIQQRPRGNHSVDRPLIVDGQQRLTTLQILLSAIRKVALEYSSESQKASRVASRIASLTLNPEATWVDVDDRYKIRHSYNRDLDSFQKVVKVEEPFTSHPSKTQDAHHVEEQSILECYRYFLQTIHEQLPQRGKLPTGDVLENLESAVTKTLQVAVIEISSSMDIYTVFGRLNANGTSLSHADYIKNEVTRSIENLPTDKRDATRSKWLFDDDWWREDTADPRVNERRVESCIKHWLSDDEGKTVIKSNIQNTFVKLVKTRGIDKVLEDLSNYACYYRDIEDGKVPAVAHFLEHIRVLGQSAIMPLLIGICTEAKSDLELRKSVAILDSYLIRRALCGTDSTGLNKYAVELAAKVKKHAFQPSILPEYSSLANILEEELSKRYSEEARLWPTDQRLLRYGAMAKITNQKRQSLFLRELEAAMGGYSLEESANLTVEHVMPRKWQKHWTLFGENTSEEDMNDAVHVIGNLTLIPKNINRRVSNDGWQEKRAAIKANIKIALNQDIMDNLPEHWDLPAIKSRSERLLSHALHIWPGPKRLWS